MTDRTSNASIPRAYRARTPGSAALAAAAREIFPSGVTHDGRFLQPHPVYIARAEGARKWDVDGHAYLDFFGGHGALILGHAHPAVTEAIRAQAPLGTHHAAGHPLEVRWGQLVQQLIPSAERVRFTASGTEATLLAIRLARGFTGRPKIVRFAGHFHGWHDHVTGAYAANFDGSAPIGVLPAVAADMIPVRPNDLDGLAALLEKRIDIAAVIMEPTGASFGRVPVAPGFVEAVREATRAAGVLLIFDEVISGFRVAPGGAQAALGVRPDLTTLAKILAGGLPGGAVAGRRDILDLLDFEASAAAGRQKVLHYGTFNANPLSAAAAVATLERVAEGWPCTRANEAAAALRQALNQLLHDRRVPWAVYGTFSGFHIFTNPEGRAVDPMAFDPLAMDPMALKANDPALLTQLRLALLVEGVDIAGWPGGLTAAVHGAPEIAETVEAFARALTSLRADGVLAG